MLLQVDKFTKLKAESEEAARQHEEDKRKNGERCMALEQELKEVAKALEKERKEAVARGLEGEKDRKRAERAEQEIAKLKSEWELQAKTKYPCPPIPPFCSLALPPLLPLPPVPPSPLCLSFRSLAPLLLFCYQ
jgi:hypothetical protein